MKKFLNFLFAPFLAVALAFGSMSAQAASVIDPIAVDASMTSLTADITTAGGYAITITLLLVAISVVVSLFKRH